MIKKIGLVVLGILLIALFELSLYFTGKFFLYIRGFNSPLDKDKFEKLICCIGDSHTFGVGASYKYSYPKQLETLLNLNNPETIFKVVNLGIPGNSTKNQIERLADFLSKNRTDLVIFLTGRNNYYDVKAWENKSFLENVIIRIKKMRTYKIIQYVLGGFFKTEDVENINAWIEMTKYENYMGYQLKKAKSLCEKHSCRLLLLSYYNSYDEDLEKFAKQLGIPYLNLYRDFFEVIPQEDITNFISRDRSHMNLYGYRVFAELLYKQMFLYGAALNLRLNPLTKKIDENRSPQEAAISNLIYIQGKSVFYP